MIRSFRARLTAWNVAVIAVVLTGFSVGIIFANQARLVADIDHELANRAFNSPPPGPPRPQGNPGDGSPGQMPDGSEQPRRQMPNGGGDLPPRFNDPTAIRFADIRRPRRFNADDEPIGPMRDAPFDRAALAKAHRGWSGYTDAEFDGKPIRIFTAPLLRSPNPGEIIQVARETTDLRQIWSAQISTLLIFLPFAILGAATGAFFLTGRAIKPIADLKAAANAISEHDLSQRLRIHGQDEFAELGATFNDMLGRLDTAFASLNVALDNQKRFTADASHELRTPLTRLRLATSSALAEAATPEDRNKALEVADNAARSMGRLVQEMLVLARADAGQLSLNTEPVDLRVVATDVADEINAINRGEARACILVDLQDSAATIDGDPDYLRRVLTNLVENALRYTPGDGEVRISVWGDRDAVHLQVADNGEGIAPEHLPHLTERFYRADPARSRSDGGSGLGLAICKTIVEAHGGTMTMDSKLGRGTTVALRFLKKPQSQTKSS